jgi:hypothetical protein
MFYPSSKFLPDPALSHSRSEYTIVFQRPANVCLGLRIQPVDQVAASRQNDLQLEG